ncbi:hypothetical protein Cob_v000644 [Colletotrichum orbiculare MAFF 240422]|uniref:Uncharacterized protein n=1 Tax=Colletotrichum orbiculare (strain 104-T / ATCC 96160 / CBS 514.97 / LARS 414 / MAFF 240422) TaxID=1213857 RepID=A0A484G5G2_COLOR|nr:hypothetical protein Cob_v000644 [Colletotrichum orbiculare MAFF 240422]
MKVDLGRVRHLWLGGAKDWTLLHAASGGAYPHCSTREVPCTLQLRVPTAPSHDSTLAQGRSGLHRRTPALVHLGVCLDLRRMGRAA